MTLTLTPLAPGSRSSFVAALRALPPAALPFFAAAVVFSTVAMASAPVSWLYHSPMNAVAVQELPDEAQSAEPAAGASKVRGKGRCNTCGVVATIRRIEPVGGLLATYEFTVRLRDGSTRVSSAASQSKWRVGDSIMLIGSTQPTAQ